MVCGAHRRKSVLMKSTLVNVWQVATVDDGPCVQLETMKYYVARKWSQRLSLLQFTDAHH